MKTVRSIDGVKRPVRSTQTPMPVPQRAAQPKPLVARAQYANQVVQPKPKKRLPTWLQIILAIPLLILVAFLIQSSVFGQLAIVVYGVVAFVRRIPSQTTFILALLSLAVTSFGLLIQGNILLSQNFATYTFLFLVAGVLTLGRELKREGGRIYSSRQNKHL